jgi:hypothetical protein
MEVVIGQTSDGARNGQTLTSTRGEVALFFIVHRPCRERRHCCGSPAFCSGGQDNSGGGGTIIWYPKKSMSASDLATVINRPPTADVANQFTVSHSCTPESPQSERTWRLKDPRQETCGYHDDKCGIIVADGAPSLYLDGAALHLNLGPYR